MHDPTVASTPTGPVFAGIDWASTDHAVCVVDSVGTVLWRHTLTHSRAGLTRLTSRLAELGVARVGIERPDGPVVEALLEAGQAVADGPPPHGAKLSSRCPRPRHDERLSTFVDVLALRTHIEL